MRFPLKYILVGTCLFISISMQAQAPATDEQSSRAPAPATSTAPAPSSEPQPASHGSASTDKPLPDAPQTQNAEEPKQKTAEEILNEEKKQKMLGIVPIYGMTNYQYAPALTAGQKFDLMARAYITVFPYLAAGFQAGISQAANNFEGYGQGASGYGKRFGSALADGADSAFFSNFFYPVLFKQDPRYFRLGEGTKKQRIWSAITQEFVTKKDSDRKPVFGYSNVLGALTAGSISNAYYPQEERGFGLTMSRTAVSFGWGMVGNFVLEFWPDVSKGLSHKHKPNTEPIK
jgi:hypothetical protein